MSAERITKNSATLQGTVNPNGLPTTYAFSYGTQTDCSTVTASGSAGDGLIAVPVSVDLAGLTPRTVYYYKLTGTNAVGSNVARGTFRTKAPNAPEVEEFQPTYVTDRSAHISGTVNPKSFATTWYFVWGLTHGLVKIDSITTVDTILDAHAVPVPPESAGSGASPVPVQADMPGLAADTQYWAQLIATNSEGTSWSDIWGINTSVAAISLTGTLDWPEVFLGDTAADDKVGGLENSGTPASTLDWNASLTLDAGLAGRFSIEPDVWSGHLATGTVVPVTFKFDPIALGTGDYAGTWNVAGQAGIEAKTLPITVHVNKGIPNTWNFKITTMQSHYLGGPWDLDRPPSYRVAQYIDGTTKSWNPAGTGTADFCTLRFNRQNTTRIIEFNWSSSRSSAGTQYSSLPGLSFDPSTGAPIFSLTTAPQDLYEWGYQYFIFEAGPGIHA